MKKQKLIDNLSRFGLHFGLFKRQKDTERTHVLICYDARSMKLIGE